MVFSRYASLRPFRFGIALGAVALISVLRCAADDSGGNDNAKSPPPDLEDSTNEQLHALQPILDAAQAATTNHDTQAAQEKWSEGVNLLNQLLPKTKEGSYDRYVVTDTLAKITWQGQNDPARAADMLESVKQMLDEHPNFVELKDRTEHIKWVGEAYYQKAIGIKHDPDAVRAAYDKSIQYMNEYVGQVKAPDQNDEMLLAMLYYSKATIDPKNPDKDGVVLAEKATRNALTLSTKPRVDLYQLLIAELLTETRFLEAADYIELMVSLKPMQRDLWDQLWAVYNQLAIEAGNNDNDALKREYLAKAILAIERAQKLGFLIKPADNYNLVTLYSAADQTQRATQIMDADLHNGTINSTPTNWEYLSNFYLQIDKPNDAINSLRDAVDRFPENSDLYLELAQYYTEVLQTDMTLKYADLAIEHDHFVHNKPWQAQNIKAYAAYELQKYDDALAAVNAALDEQPENPNETDIKQLTQFKGAIEAAIKQRDQIKKATGSL